MSLFLSLRLNCITSCLSLFSLSSPVPMTDSLASLRLIAETGMSVSTVYGNLSPEVRRAQAQRFRDGEADVVVATDALAMGLNMPISRVVLTTAVKFNGVEEEERLDPLMSVFEGGRGQDLAELVGQLFLIEVAEEEKGEGLLVRGPVDIAYRALDCRV